ncbi:MAG: hypothetical protein RO257_11325 [Candidatus Kapabacteria bacterium]|jgi:hypothetical protein|nr:hypothetical protein [Candidatus Kapabacteria bacterium]
MNKMKLFIVIIIGLCFTFPALYSQGGSNYSIIGIGDINYGGNASYTAMGGTQIAFPSENSINSRNPAMWSFVTSTRLQAGYKFNQNAVTGSDFTIWHNNGAMSGFAGIFAIDSALGISASFGIVPSSNINYLTATETTINQMGLDLKGITTYQGSGGVSQAYAGVSTKITDWLGVGASFYASFGVVESSRETKFESDFYSFTYTTTKSDYIGGWGSKAGLFVIPAKDLILGLSLEAQPNLTVNTETKYKSTTLADTTLKSDSEISIPALLGIGASYTSGNFIFGADLSMRDFTSFDYNLGSNSEFTNSYLATIGVNRMGNRSLNAPFADRVSYKFGLGYNQLYYKVLGSQLQEYTAAAGMQMPFTGTMIVDLSFILGSRTSGNPNLVSEYFIRFGVDVSIGETWFVPFRRDY